MGHTFVRKNIRKNRAFLLLVNSDW